MREGEINPHYAEAASDELLTLLAEEVTDIVIIQEDVKH